MLMVIVGGCASPPPPVPVEERSTIAVDREPTAAPAPPPSLSLEAYKASVARRILERNADRSFSGPLPPMLPAIVVIIGIIEVYGAKGWLGGFFDIYGLQGILLAHVFFNVPLAARLILADLERSPAESWKLSAQLGLGPLAIWRLLEWPAIRSGLAGAALLIFLLCASSFAVVLTLGGGPRATTLEVAI
jgi:ABC-type spermidine/putrescine transport system permease subunit II